MTTNKNVLQPSTRWKAFLNRVNLSLAFRYITIQVDVTRMTIAQSVVVRWKTSMTTNTTWKISSKPQMRNLLSDYSHGTHCQ